MKKEMVFGKIPVQGTIVLTCVLVHGINSSFVGQTLARSLASLRKKTRREPRCFVGSACTDKLPIVLVHIVLLLKYNVAQARQVKVVAGWALVYEHRYGLGAHAHKLYKQY